MCRIVSKHTRRLAVIRIDDLDQSGAQTRTASWYTDTPFVTPIFLQDARVQFCACQYSKKCTSIPLHHTQSTAEGKNSRKMPDPSITVRG